VQSLVDEGRISVDEVSTHPQRGEMLLAQDGRSVADCPMTPADPGDLACPCGGLGLVRHPPGQAFRSHAHPLGMVRSAAGGGSVG